MSFSIDGESDELARAIDYAVRRGSLCVAAAGNDGASVLVYPAAIPEAIGVAATDLDDFVAPFSNYGNDLVKLAAPGVAVITTYPGGGWAAASGTSFSTPWVSGGIALWPSARSATASCSISIECSTLSRTAPTFRVARARRRIRAGRLRARAGRT